MHLLDVYLISSTKNWLLRCQKSSFEFSQLFDVVHERLKERKAAGGGEEMLRLRAYEKLQNLVSRGMVKKTGKKYKGLASLAKALPPPEAAPSAK